MKILSKAKGNHGLLELDSSSPQTVTGTVYFDNAYFNKVPFVDVDNVSVPLATLNSLDVTTNTKEGTHIATLKWGLIEYELYAPSCDLTNYITLNTVQTVTGTKTFSNPAFRGQLIIERSESSGDSVIAFRNNKGLLGSLGYRGTDGVACVWDGNTSTGVPIATQTWVEDTYATLDDVTAVYDYIDGIDFSSYLTDYATKKWVGGNYYTATQIDNKLISFVTLEGGTATWARRHIFKDGTVYPITVNGVGDRAGIDFTIGDTSWGKLGFSAVNTPAFFTTEGTAEPLATQSWVEGKEYITSSALTEYAKSSILPHTVASYTNGCLVKTDVSADANSMIYFRIEGNSYGGGYEILTCGQFYNYQSGNSILNYKATHYGYDFGDIKVFNYDGFVFLWFKQQSAFQTFNVCVWRSSASLTTSYNALNRVTSISNIAMPTSGVTRLQTITPQITPHIVGGRMVIPSIDGGESSLTFQTGTLTDGSYDYKIGKFTDKNNISGFGMGIADSSGKWSKFLGLTTDGQYKVTSVNINNNLAIIGSLTAETDIFGNGWSVEGGIANFGELNATDVYADSVTVGDTSVASKSYSIPVVSDKRWVRIAEMTSDISCGTITISKGYNSINSIPTQHAVFHVQSGYVQSDGIKAEYNITQLSCTCNTDSDSDSDQYFTRVRIVYANPTTSTSKASVEVFCNFDTAETLKVSLSGCINMSLLSAYTLGSVPTGYDYRSIDLQPGGARNECYQMIDLSASTYNRDYFYPVVGSKLSASGGFTRIEVRNNLNDELEDNVPSWSTHTRGFTANMVVYARGSEDDVNVGQTFCVDYNYLHTAKNPVGYSQMTNSSLPVLWLRGGGKYNVYTDRLMRWNVKTSTFTSNSESVAPQSGGTAPFNFTKANLYANMEQVGVTANGTYITFGDEDTSIFAGGTIIMRGEVQLGNTYGYGFSETGDGVLLSLKAQTITQTSDLTRKNILEDVLFTVEDVAAAPFVKFQWNDRPNDLDVNVGSIAQYWKNILPEAIHGKVGENLSMEYQTIALGSSIITAREVVKLKEEIKSLKEKIVELEKSKE